MPLPPSPLDALRNGLVGQVRAVFNDGARGETPVERSDDALYSPGSVIWRVHGDVTTMMVGGMTALLLQMLHPAALTAVLGHSNFRTDMLGRLRRTARFIAVTTFGDRAAAEAAIARVRGIHARVNGTLADGTPYAASDPRLLAWVHAAEATGFLDAWIAYGQPGMPLRDQDRYFAQAGVVARALGADPVPETRRAAAVFIDRMRGELVGSADARAVARLILAPGAGNPGTLAVQRLLARSAVQLLPGWARTMLDLKARPGERLLTGPATAGIASTLRWAFAGQR